MALALIAAGPALAAAKTGADDPIVAKVNGAAIHRSEVVDAIDHLPQQYREMPPDAVFGAVLAQIINRRLVMDAANAANIANDPDVRKRLSESREDILIEAFIARETDKEVTDAKVKAAYDEAVKEQSASDSIHVRHILVASETAANEIIAELKKGADFATLAKTRSTDTSAAHGGDLGLITRQQVLPEFADAAFALKAGQYTQSPVKTEFGWHVIKVEERNSPAMPSYEESKANIRSELAADASSDIIQRLRVKAKIEQFNADGSIVKPDMPNSAPPSASLPSVSTLVTGPSVATNAPAPVASPPATPDAAPAAVAKTAPAAAPAQPPAAAAPPQKTVTTPPQAAIPAPQAPAPAPAAAKTAALESKVPANAAGNNAGAPPASDKAVPAEVAALLARGDAFLGSGDIVSARLFYQRAADAGDRRAALLMGETYDPALLARTGIRGIHGDAALAAEWYRRARDLGAPEADALLKGLETRK
ncbi:MAG TPA: peptidylprolyl isomerase [Candidatus Cybelea sp.]|nr:peptidylprolyl isomerase [Candidatus Cybelea sp.]